MHISTVLIRQLLRTFLQGMSSMLGKLEQPNFIPSSKVVFMVVLGLRPQYLEYSRDLAL